MLNFFKKYRHYFILGLGALFLIGLPIINQFSAVGWHWQGVPLDIPNYYYARQYEILDGQPFMGNPYFWEHRQEIAPAFFLADWLVVIPVLLGFSTGVASLINLIGFTALFIWLGYYWLGQVGVSKIWSSVGALLVTVLVYSYLITPVSMQVIYPTFLLFLIAFWQWRENPFAKKTQIFLVSASVLTFYIYTYLWQIAMAWLGLFFLYFLYTKEYKLVKRLFGLGLFTFIFSLPLFVYTWKQISHPFYWDSMERIGLVYTHLPTMVVFYTGEWLFLLTLLWYLFYLWTKEVRGSVEYRKVGLFLASLGLALLIACLSNVFLGKELETAQHVDRFIKVWFGLSITSWLFFYKKFFSSLKNRSIVKTWIIALLAGFIILGGGYYYSAGEIVNLVPKLSVNKDRVRIQEKISSLQWLESAETKPVVVWSNSEMLNSLLPITTKHYVLFTNYGILHLLSSEEVEDRYLISKYFSNLDRAVLEADLRQYAGSARALHEANTHNREVRLCQILQLKTFNLVKDCGKLTNPIAWKGESYFSNLLVNYRANVSSNITDKLARYHVTYLIKDIDGDKDFAPEKIVGTRLVHADAQMKIYKLEY